MTTVHLGFEVGTGEPVEIPLAHTFVTGQTQLSGKTTTLQAIVERAGGRALAFITKRGEQLEGRRIRPYLPREGLEQIPWRLVETIMASALGQRNMKWERGAIVVASKGATTLEQVRRNVERLREKCRDGTKTDELYMLLGEYLDLVLPEMKRLNAAAELDLQPGLNVIDVADVNAQTQALVIRAALEHVNRREKGVLVVFPEAWEFAPRDRMTPAKDAAIALARKGAALGNFLLCDSQDIAGVDTVVRQGASVWILGVQRELNEIKRTLAMMPRGTVKPQPEDITQLELGQFFACWGRHAVKTYVQPTWLDDLDAIAIARGNVPVVLARRGLPKEDTVDKETAARLERENQRLQDDLQAAIRARGDQERRCGQLELELRALREEYTAFVKEMKASGMAPHDDVDDRAEALVRGIDAAIGTEPPPAVDAFTRQAKAPPAGRQAFHGKSIVDEALYQEIKTRLLSEVDFGGAKVLQVTAPEKLRHDYQQAAVERLLSRVAELEPLGKEIVRFLIAMERRMTLVQVAEGLGRASNSGGGMKTLREHAAKVKDSGLIESTTNGFAENVRACVKSELAMYAPPDDEIDDVVRHIHHAVAKERVAA